MSDTQKAATTTTTKKATAKKAATKAEAKPNGKAILKEVEKMSRTELLAHAKKLEAKNDEQAEIIEKSMNKSLVAMVEEFDELDEETQLLVRDHIEEMNRAGAPLPERIVYFIEDTVGRYAWSAGLLAAIGYGTVQGGKAAWKGGKALWALVRGNPVEAVVEATGAAEDLFNS